MYFIYAFTSKSEKSHVSQKKREWKNKKSNNDYLSTHHRKIEAQSMQTQVHMLESGKKSSEKNLQNGGGKMQAYKNDKC